ncbi:TPA: porin [Salmonella enterica]|nr:porin [Salmonella enterica]
MKVRLFLIPLFFFTMIAHATTFDYRHEMNDGSGPQKDRLLIINRFNNGFGLSLQGKWKGSKKDNKAYYETVSNGTEVIASYLYKFNPNYSIESAFSLDSGSSFNSYRPYLRGKINFTDELSYSLRYRPYYKRNSTDVGTNKKTHETGYHLTGVLSYKPLKNFTFDYEIEYRKVNSYGIILGNKQNYDLSHDFKVSYAYNKSWTPYIAIGNIPGSKQTSERQTRYRFGLKYHF